jgi:hypothetical protein
MLLFNLVFFLKENIKSEEIQYQIQQAYLKNKWFEKEKCRTSIRRNYFYA